MKFLYKIEGKKVNAKLYKDKEKPKGWSDNPFKLMDELKKPHDVGLITYV